MTDAMVSQSISPWQELVLALDQEIDLVRALRDLAASARTALSRVQVAAVIDWVQRQRAVLERLDAAGRLRREVIERCLGAAAGAAATFRTLLAVAPEEVVPRLRQQSEDLRKLCDEVAVHSARNEAVVRQVLEFTDDIGRNLVARQETPSYAATGRRAQLAMAGDLLRQAL
jgi:hypothetical protein